MTPTTVLADGRHPDGAHVRAVQNGHDRRDVTITVDGTPVDVDRVDVYRDGGTTHYYTGRGTLCLPRRINDDDRRPRWRGEVLR